jgi:IS30 family transposase
MANQLKMAMSQALLALHARGWSQRRIARELGIDRGTVARYLQLAEQAKPAISLNGWDQPGAKPANVHIKSSGRDRASQVDKPRRAEGLPCSRVVHESHKRARPRETIEIMIDIYDTEEWLPKSRPHLLQT